MAVFDELVMEGRAPDTAEFCARFAHLTNLPHHLQILRSLREHASPLGAPTGSPPRTQFGEFELVRQLGSGGMGQVYLAWQKQPRRLCAVKTLPLAGLHNIDRFRREAAITAKLEHPHIAAVYGAGQFDNWAYLALQLIYGSSLRAVLQNADVASTQHSWLSDVLSVASNGVDSSGVGTTPVPFTIATELARQTATALAHAHDLGIVHRDIKPTNIMLTVSGQIKVIDFGIAVTWMEDDGRLTATGGFVGSYDYAAPEQLQGERTEIGPWTDTYALGVTLFEMLTQRLPYAGAGFADRLRQVDAQLAAGPRQLEPSTPRHLDALVRKALCINPKDRFQDGAEMADALAEANTVGQSGRSTMVTVSQELRRTYFLRAQGRNLIWFCICAALFAWGLQQNAARTRAQHDFEDIEARRDNAVVDVVIFRNRAPFKQCVVSTKKPGKFVPAVLPPLFEATVVVRGESVQDVRVSSFCRNLSAAAKACMASVLKTLEFPGVGIGVNREVKVSLVLPDDIEATPPAKADGQARP